MVAPNGATNFTDGTGSGTCHFPASLTPSYTADISHLSYPKDCLTFSVWLVCGTNALSECGDFYDIGVGILGNLYSPNFPNVYPENSFCVWLIRVPERHQVQIVLDFVGERYNEVCADYVEIRDGSRRENVIGKFCDTTLNTVITSRRNVIWIKFKSDRVNTTGSPMHAQFYAIPNHTVSKNGTFLIQECKSYEFVCRNKECISMSYRCDGHNDCGCLTDCDESLCTGLDIPKSTQVIIALVTGVLVFSILCLITYCIEGKNHWIASQAEALREKEILAEKQRQRASRAFTKFIGGEKEMLTTVTKSKVNISSSKINFTGPLR